MGERGGADDRGTLYPSLSTDTTHSSAPLRLQACQDWDRQPPILLGEGRSSYLRKSLDCGGGGDFAVDLGLNLTFFGVLAPEDLGEGDLDLLRPLWYLEGE